MSLCATKTSDNEEKTEYDKLTDKCKLLFSKTFLTRQSKYGSCSIGCSSGWYEPLKKLCCKLEALNLTYYPKYRVRVEAQQIKEKFGTLRFYHQVKVDPSVFKMLVIKTFGSLHSLMRDKIDFKYKDVVDVPAYVSHEIVELKKSQYLKEQSRYLNCSNVHCEERDGKYFKISDMDHYVQSHRVPTKHKIAHFLMMKCWRIVTSMTSGSFGERYDSKQYVISEMVDSLVEQYVKEAENECFNVCEKCGHQIGSDWSPRCEMLGWVQYLCDECAEESGNRYKKNGEIWQGSTIVQTAEDVKKASDKTDEALKRASRNEKIRNEKLEKEIAEAEKEEEENLKRKEETKDESKV